MNTETFTRFGGEKEVRRGAARHGEHRSLPHVEVVDADVVPDDVAFGARDGFSNHGHAARSDVQFGQRTAPSGIVNRQYGQGFVVGAASGPRCMRLTWRTTRKMTKATMTKSMIVLMKIP
jgi:hypothetical protein